MLEHVYIKLMRKFEYDGTNIFQEICTEKLPFHPSKKLCLPNSLVFVLVLFGQNLYQRYYKV